MGLLHASILNILPGVKLAAVCEKGSFTRKLVKKVLNDIPVVGDVNEFSGLNLDAVFVTTSTLSHFSVAKMLYQKQIARHLFIEKPLAWNYAQSKKLCALAAQNNGVNMVGYLRRFMVTFMKAKELLNHGVIGESVSFKVNGFSSDFCGIQDSKMSVARGGILRDLGSYAIDIALWFFGELEAKSASIESLTESDAEDAVHFIMHRKTDRLEGEFSVSWCAEGYRMPEVILFIEGSKGNIEVNDDKVSLKLKDGKISNMYRHNLNDNSVKFWLGGPEYYREDAYFVDCVRNNFVAEPTFDAASKVDFVIDAIHRTVEEHE